MIEWGIVEFPSVLALKLRTRQLNDAHSTSAVAAFTHLCEESFEVLAVESGDFRVAARFADQHATGLRSGDALHLSIVSNRGARLWTLDKSIAKAGRTLGLSVQLL